MCVWIGSYFDAHFMEFYILLPFSSLLWHYYLEVGKDFNIKIRVESQIGFVYSKNYA